MTAKGPERISDSDWFFEDFEPGQVIVTMRRTVTETDLVSFVRLGGFFEEIWLDANKAVEDTDYGRRIIPGYLTLIFAEGLFVLTGRMHRAVGLVGLDKMMLTAPVAVGDTIHCEIEVLTTRRTRSGHRGIVTTMHRVFAQRADQVMSYQTARLILARKPADPV